MTKIKLQNKPNEGSETTLALAKDLNSFYFPGCQLPKWDRSYVWLVYSNEEVAGFATMRRIEGEKYGYLERVAILRKFRGQGLQKKLIDVRVRYAKVLGWKGVLTYTVADNYPSINSLMHKGFSIYSPEWAWAGRDVLYFKKDF